MSSKTAATIREALKAAGYGRTDVSVRNDSYSMGSTVHVKVRLAYIALDAVEAIAKAHEVVRRDESGDILGGGNTFVDVEYAAGVLDPAIVTIREMLDAGQGGFGKLQIGAIQNDPDRFDVWECGPGLGRERAHITRIYREFGAEGLTRLLAARGELAAVLDAEAVAACANDTAAEVDSEAPSAAAEALEAAPLPPPAPAAAPRGAEPLIAARRALIAAQLADLAAQLAAFDGDTWGDAGTLAGVVAALDAVPVFGRAT